jgi:hypothetical protein
MDYDYRLQRVLQAIDTADITLQTKQLAVDAAVRHAFAACPAACSQAPYECQAELSNEPGLDFWCAESVTNAALPLVAAYEQSANEVTEAEHGQLEDDVESWPADPLVLGADAQEMQAEPPNDDARETPSEPPIGDRIMAVHDDDAQKTPTKNFKRDKNVAVLGDDAQEAPAELANGDEIIAVLYEDAQETPAEPPNGNHIIAVEGAAIILQPPTCGLLQQTPAEPPNGDVINAVMDDNAIVGQLDDGQLDDGQLNGQLDDGRPNSSSISVTKHASWADEADSDESVPHAWITYGAASPRKQRKCAAQRRIERRDRVRARRPDDGQLEGQPNAGQLDDKLVGGQVDGGQFEAGQLDSKQRSKARLMLETGLNAMMSQGIMDQDLVDVILKTADLPECDLLELLSQSNIEVSVHDAE